MSSATRLVGLREPAVAHDWDSLHYWLIFAFSFPVYLAGAVGHRLMPSYWLGAARRRSVLAEAWTASDTTARIAFSG